MSFAPRKGPLLHTCTQGARLVGLPLTGTQLMTDEEKSLVNTYNIHLEDIHNHRTMSNIRKVRIRTIDEKHHTIVYHTNLCLNFFSFKSELSDQVQWERTKLGIWEFLDFKDKNSTGIYMTWSSYHRLTCPEICLTSCRDGRDITLVSKGCTYWTSQNEGTFLFGRVICLLILSPSKSCSFLNNSSIFTFGTPHIFVA